MQDSESGSRRRLKVVQLLPALNAGGVERGVLEIAHALVDAGHEAHVISAGGRMVAALEEMGAVHHVLPIGDKSLRTLAQVRPLRRLLLALTPDVIHVRSRLPAWLLHFARRAAPLAQVPLVSTVHGLYSVSRYSRIMTRADCVIAVSAACRDYILANYGDVDRARIRVIARGVDGARFTRGFTPDTAWQEQWHAQYPQLRGRRFLVLAGRFTRRKGHAEAIALLARLRARFPELMLVLVGEAASGKARYHAEIVQQINTAGLQDAVVFTGQRADLREIFALSALVLCLSAQPESFGRTVLEALALGVPVLGWAHGGAAEIMQALLPEGAVAVGDMDALVATAEQFLAAPAPAIAALPAEFLLSAMCTQTLATYGQLAAVAL